MIVAGSLWRWGTTAEVIDNVKCSAWMQAIFSCFPQHSFRKCCPFKQGHLLFFFFFFVKALWQKLELDQWDLSSWVKNFLFTFKLAFLPSPAVHLKITLMLLVNSRSWNSKRNSNANVLYNFPKIRLDEVFPL